MSRRVDGNYGCPKCLKIDIEGADAALLADFSPLRVLPEFVSWEMGKESLRTVFQQHRQLESLGYGRFRMVQEDYQEQQQQAIGSSE